MARHGLLIFEPYLTNNSVYHRIHFFMGDYGLMKIFPSGFQTGCHIESLWLLPQPQ
jgi:hypothetical protein